MKKKFKLCHPKGIAVIMIAVLSAAVMSACSGGNTAGESMTDESIKIAFTDSEITSEGASAGFETEGTELTINESGTYILSGSCDNGSVKVKKGTVGVTLVLNGLNLTSADTAAIACNKST